MSPPPAIQTPLCTLLGIKYPILLAGMARTSGAPLAAAVSNAGGMGCIGGLGYTPKQLQEVSLSATSPCGIPFGALLIDF
jgi:NAD(P)H-dependent flavin oxidoreductase YrpB (nitropropane dioxygenase family)